MRNEQLDLTTFQKLSNLSPITKRLIISLPVFLFYHASYTQQIQRKISASSRSA